MKSFLSSTGGITLQLAAVLMFVGGGGAAVIAGSGLSLYMFTASLLVAILMGIVGVGLATIEHDFHALAAVIAAPVLLFLVNLGLLLAMQYAPSTGFASIALGVGVLFAMAWGLRGLRRDARQLAGDEAHAPA